jgi:hypothetical protein
VANAAVYQSVHEALVLFLLLRKLNGLLNEEGDEQIPTSNLIPPISSAR